MESRMDKYYKEQPQEFSRSKRNEKLYKQVYGSYSDLEYLPVSDNVSEIDAKKLREIVTSREEYQKNKIQEKDDIIVSETKQQDNKIYDINELIEKARNSKPKVVQRKEDIQSYNFLKTLESKELLKSDIKEASEKEEKNVEENKEDATISSGNNTLSLDILSDLKDDTVLSEPVKKENTYDDIIQNDDIPIDNKINDEDKAFYSGSYKFSDKDFFDEDYNKIASNGNFIKVVFVIIMLSICATGIYFLIDFLGKR